MEVRGCITAVTKKTLQAVFLCTSLPICDLLSGVEVVEGGMKRKRKRRTSVVIHQREG